jgi:3-oxoacyl-[acyl-carrier-protein] synthase II
MGVVCAVGRNAEEFASALRAATCGIGPVDHVETHWTPCDIGGEVKQFEPLPMPELTLRRDRGVDLALTAAAEALQTSGLDTAARNAMRIGVSMGTCQNGVLALCELIEQDEPSLRPIDDAAEVVARGFALSGPRIAASNACSAAGSAITIARDQLAAGTADVMLAGGADALAFFTYAGFSVLHSLDLAPCSPYGRSEGLTLGEGAAVLVLETAEHALARGAPILGELAGCGGSADGYNPTAPDPTGRYAALALRRALEQAAVDPVAVDYVNGHGTGTPSNDEMERAAFRLVFGDRTPEVPISSTKSMVGHTLGAAGAIEAAACLIAIRDGFLPPTVNMPPGAPQDFDFVPNMSRSQRVRVAVSNNYAFGGSNTSLVFTESVRQRPPARDRPENDVLITGLGAVGGLGHGLSEWADALAQGRSAVSPVEVSDASGVFKGLGVVTAPPPAGRYASRADWRKMNSLARLCVASTRMALHDSHLDPNREQLDGIGTLLATTCGTLKEMNAFHRSALVDGGDASPLSFPHTAATAAAGHVCTVIGLHGPMLTIAGGSVGGLLALEHGATLIRHGDAELVLVLGADEISHASVQVNTRKDWQRITHEAVRPFDERGDGTAFGTAAVAVLLESEEHARRRNATPYGRVLGSWVEGSLVEAGDATATDLWVETMSRALERSQLEPSDVSYAVADARGYRSLDELELAAVAKLFGPNVALTAPKSLTGLCMGADALVNLLVASLALRDGTLTPTANLDRPLPEFVVRHVSAPSRSTVEHAIVNVASVGSAYGSLVVGSAR